MNNLETIMQDGELVKDAVKEYLVNHCCPMEFNLPKLRECKLISNRIYGKCKVCWDKALKNQ